jgi:8-oxo-dGTP diphosphatase
MSNISFKKLNEQTRTPLLDVVRVVSLSEDGVLLVKEADDENWKLTGGKIHEGETILEAMQREVKEELGIQIEREEILNYKSANIPNSENIRHIFLVAEVKPESISKTEELEEARYFKLSELPETKFREHILSAIDIITL